LPILSNLKTFLDVASPKAGHRQGLIALDVSKRMIGVAGSDPDWQLATPLLSIKRTKLQKDIDKLQSLRDEREAAALVIGLPLNMDGSEGPRCQAIRQFAADVDKALALPTILWDERLTTFEAEERADELGFRGPKKTDLIDAIAAALILEDLLSAIQRNGASS